MKGARNSFLLWAVFLLLPACGQSPLLHHLGPRTPTLTHSEGLSGEGPCAIPFVRHGLCGTLSWGAGTAEGSQPFELKLRARGAAGGSVGQPIDPRAELSVLLWMPEHGHGSSPVQIRRLDLGVYSISEVYFIMPGHWIVRVILKDPDGGDERGEVPYAAP